MTEISFPRVDSPVVTVIMVTYGGWEWTERSLSSLRDNTSLPYELIVVDNASPDGTARRLTEEVSGAKIVVNERNEGFGPANNTAAEEARGEYLVLLNNDALVQPGWLEPLLETARTDPVAGAVVPRLLNLDGTVQEAGSFVWSDGSTEAYGAGADALDPAYLFRRYTDYGSAACLLMRRSLFLDAGGFDPAYLPAYCEDVDLQLTLRAGGLRTVFEPGSEVVHVRFGASGEGEGARLIRSNRRILSERWAHVLDRHVPPPMPGRPHRIVAARDREAHERILVLGEQGGEEVAAALAFGMPSSRITLIPEGADPGLRRAGVEALARPEHPQEWLRARRFHYSAAVLAPSDRTFRGLVEATQPQAALIELQSPDEVKARLDDLGIVDELAV